MKWKKAKDKVDSILAWTLIVLMAANVFNVLWQVFTRFILKNPSAFTEELARFLLIWVGLLGAAYAAGRKMHLAIEVILERLEGKIREIAEFTIQFFILLFGITLALEQISAALRVKLGYIYLVLPISGLLIMFYALVFIMGRIKGKEIQ